MRDSIGYDWVIGTWLGDQARSVLDHANAGIGYFILKTGKDGSQLVVTAAFRRPADSPIPNNLMAAEPYQVKKFEEMYAVRHGTQVKRSEQIRTQSITDIIGEKK